MNYSDSPSWEKAADVHAMAAEDTSIYDDVVGIVNAAPRFVGLSLASGVHSIYDTGLWGANLLLPENSEFERTSFGEKVAAYDEDLGQYYRDNQQGIDLTGFVVTSFVPGLAAMKGVHAGQAALRAASAGQVGGNMVRATKILAPVAENYVKREAAQLAAKQASFSFLHTNSLKALAAGAQQGVIEGIAWEAAVLATMNQAPIFSEMDAWDITKNAMMGVGFSAGVGVLGTAATSYFKTGELLKAADARSRPFRELSQTSGSASHLPSDRAVNAMMDVERLQAMEVTSDYVLAQKLAAGETGESIAEAAVQAEVIGIDRLRQGAIQTAQNEFRTAVREMSNGDELGNIVASFTDKLEPGNAMRLIFNAKEIVRGAEKTKLDKWSAKAVKDGLFKTKKEALASRAAEEANAYVVLHSGNIGDQLFGTGPRMRLADKMPKAQVEAKLKANPYRPTVKHDFRKMTPSQAEVLWMGVRRSKANFPKGYVWESHDLVALQRAVDMRLDSIAVKIGDDVTPIVGEQAIKDYLYKAKLETAQAHLGRKGHVSMEGLEAITEVRADVISGAAKNLDPEDAFNATASYAKEYSKFVGRELDPLRAVDLDLMPRVAKVVYRTAETTDDAGMVLKGMEVIKHREKLAVDAAKRYFAHYAEDMFELFPDIPEDVLRTMWRGEGGAGLATNAGGQYGSMASTASYVGGLVSQMKKAKMEAVTDVVTPVAQKLLNSPDDAVRLSGIESVVAGAPESYVMDETGEYLITISMQNYLKKEGMLVDDIVKGAGDNVPQTVGPQWIKLETPVIREAVATRIALTAKRDESWNALHAVQGNLNERPAGVFLPVRPDPRDYKHVAFVKDEKLVGAGHTQMIFAQDAAKLDSMIAEVHKMGGYKVYTKGQAEEFYKARGEWEFDKTLHSNYVQTELQKRGIMTDFFPPTDPQKVVNRWLQDEIRRENALLSESVLIRYEKEFSEMKRMAAQWDQTRTSIKGSRNVHDMLTAASDGNPYVGMMKSMMDVTRIEDMPILLRSANETLDAVVSRGWNAADDFLRELRGKTPTDADVEKVNKIFEEVGFQSAYTRAAMELANAKVPRGVLSTFVRTANAVLTTTMLRLDAFNAITNKVGMAILYSPEVKGLLKDIKGNAAAAGELRGLSQIKLVGADADIFSWQKLLSNSYRRLHGEGGEALREVYKKRGLLPDLADQQFRSLDAMTLTGAESVGDMSKLTTKLKERLKTFSAKGEALTGNKFVEETNRLYALDTMKQITEVAVKHGIIDERMAWTYVNTFNNRVNGVIRASERPLMFQGPIGQAMGLFQSYQLNLMQQVFRHIGEGRTKELALMAGLQGSIFGATSLPGYNLINNNLIAQASGNTEHYDIQSGVRSIFGQDVADWIMYGAPSNILNASLYTRGDTNPRTWHIVPNPTNPSELPFVSAFSKMAGSIYDATSRAAGGAPIWQSFLSGVEHMGISRPLAGLAATARAATSEGNQVISTQRNGTVAGSNDFFELATLMRLAGAKPLDEAIVTNNYYRINAYAAQDRIKRMELGTEIKLSIIDGSVPEDEAINEFAERYVAYGGTQSGFASFWMNQYKNTDMTVADQLASRLDSPYARRMQEIMGGRDSLFDTGDL